MFFKIHLKDNFIVYNNNFYKFNLFLYLFRFKLIYSNISIIYIISNQNSLNIKNNIIFCD